MIDPIQKLADIYPALENGQKAKAREVKEAILEMQARLADLESTLQRQPLPEAPASLSAKVVDPATQIEWMVTVREARAGVVLISAMPSINEALAERGLIAPDAYADGRRAERESHTPNAGATLPANGGPPLCPDGHGAMKQSTKAAGEWYCSYSVGVHPQTQKKLYCMHKAKA